MDWPRWFDGDNGPEKLMMDDCGGKIKPFNRWSKGRGTPVHHQVASIDE
jgi:hypothetical protein